jgi:hypothetical protein
MGIDVGKSAKAMGSVRPRDARRADPAPPRPLSRAAGRKVTKNFGVTIEEKNWRTKDWERRLWSWHETAKQRDQALGALKKRPGIWYRDPQPIDRAAYQESESL